MNTPSIRRFLKRLPFAAACGLALLLAGCNDPEETVLWSPDGQHGLVRGNEIVVVNDAGAIIAKPFPKQDGEPSVGVESWMPDSQRVLAVRAVKAKNWSEIAPLLGVERAQAVMRAADDMLRWIKEYRGDGYRRQDLVYQAQPGFWVTANLYLPNDSKDRMPGIIIAHSLHAPKTQFELQDMGQFMRPESAVRLRPVFVAEQDRVAAALIGACR